ncbi:MAG TPA: hopanoid-associated phosphorylase [Stellaceae bacterium]|nr:hopanoid-associated phosphorylase [Stellaceae bacterium]
MTVGAVTGLAAEAALARELGLAAAVGAGTRARTEAAVADLLARPVLGLVSFGIAGGLAPGLPTGTVVLPAAVRGSDGSAHWVDIDWHERLAKAARAAKLAVVVGGMLGADEIAATAAAKADLHRTTRAIAVDLESHVVAAAAARARVPFVVLRTIADTAGQDLPPAALLPLTRRGRPSLPRVLISLALRPRQIPALKTLDREFRTALDALRKAGRALGEALLRI